MRTQCTAALLLAAVTSAYPLAGDIPAAPVTFSRDVEPILTSHCAVCHSPGGPSPMPLARYEDAVRWADAIKTQALSRQMPKWHAARGYGTFTNDPSLSPYELKVLVAWTDGDKLIGSITRSPAATSVPIRTGFSLPPNAVTATVRAHAGWISGWDFTPGDPLITSATFTSADGSVLGTWTAGDRAVRLPAGSGIRVVSPIGVEIQRRTRAAYETAFTPRASSLRVFWWAPAQSETRRTPVRRVWTERVACGGTLGPADASVIAIRPLLATGASALIGLERIGGAPPALLGWFRAFDARYPRIYWLASPIDFAALARLTSDTPCSVDVVFSARR
jgi:hypothetical protein